MGRALLKLAVSGTLLLVVSCGDSGGFGLTTTSVPGPTSVPGTTAPGTAPTTTVADDELALPILGDPQPIPVEPITAEADIVLGGAPDERAADAIGEAVAALGVDTTGMEIWVFPIADTGNSLLVLEFDSATAPAPDQPVDETAGQQLFSTILDHPLIDALPVTHVALNYRNQDAQGEFVFTIADTLANFRTAVATGGDMTTAQMQVVRVGEGP